MSVKLTGAACAPLGKSYSGQNSTDLGASSMRTFGVYEAKNRLSELLELVENGEEILITNHGRPVARLLAPAKVRDEAVAELSPRRRA